MSPLQIFAYEAREVRVVMRDGEPWFVGKDLAEILGYSRPRDAIREHCKAFRPLGGGGGETPPPSLDPQTLIIPERDVYRLVMRSKLPAAERFEEWVVGEVLPSIRKTGAYVAGLEPEVGELIRRTDGIARMLSRKVTEIEGAVAGFAARLSAIEGVVAGLAVIADPRVAALDLISVRELLDDSGALPKGRNRLNRRIGAALRDLALRQGVAGCRRSPHTGARIWLFPIPFARAFMRDVGAAWVREHNDRVAGQGVLKFPRRVPPAPPASRSPAPDAAG